MVRRTAKAPIVVAALAVALVGTWVLLERESPRTERSPPMGEDVTAEVRRDTLESGRRTELSSARQELSASSPQEPLEVSMTPEAVRRLPADYKRYFATFELEPFQRENWSHTALLEWGCRRAPGAQQMPELFDHSFVRLPISPRKPIERASEEQRSRIEELQSTYLAACGDVIEESKALAEMLVRENNQVRNVQHFTTEAALLEADPAVTVEQWGFVFGWTLDGEYCLLRFDTSDHPQLAAGIAYIETHKTVRDREVIRIMSEVK